MNRNNLIIGIVWAAMGIGTYTTGVAAETQGVVTPAVTEPLFATVNGTSITQKEFHAAYSNYVRQKFYHGQVQEGQLQEAKKAVADQLVERVLLLEEAKRRDISPDESRIEETIAGYEKRYAGSQVWQQRRENLLPGLRQQLAEQQLIEQMENIGRAFPEPSEEAVRTYYSAHTDLFVEPEKMRLHTILLKVDPAAPKATWDAAREEAQRILDRHKGGAQFEELARMHSNDASAEKGGDMGYLHRGMIPDQVQAQIDQHPLGEVTPPIDVLEGVALFRLDERIAAKQVGFDQAAGRARELLKREEAQNAWAAFIAGLRSKADIRLYDEAEQPGKKADAQ